MVGVKGGRMEVEEAKGEGKGTHALTKKGSDERKKKSETKNKK